MSNIGTLSLIDPDQGVCPQGHECDLLAREGGWSRSCRECDYIGVPLARWDITAGAIRAAEAAGAADYMVHEARASLAGRAS